MSLRTSTRFGALVVLVLAALAAHTQARTPRAAPQATACHARLTVLAHGRGSPDDLVWDGSTLLVSDINGGTIDAVSHGHAHIVVGHLHEPEGVVPGPGHSLIVAEQGTNSVVKIALPSRARTTLARLPLPAGQSGLDGINADGANAVYVPDSARGRLYVLHLKPRKLSLVARGMIRPVAAITYHGATVVADEYANAVWMIAHHHRTQLAHVPLPDDLVVISGHLIANSLIGQVWEVAPHLRLLSAAFGPTTTDPQGLAPDGPGAVIVADQARNTIYRLSRLAPCL